MTHIQRPTILAALLALTAGTAGAQERQGAEEAPAPKTDAKGTQDKTGQEKPAEERPEVTFEDLWPSEADPQQDKQQEIADLFAKVERRLRLIDTMLLDASAGETTRLDELGSGMEDLLDEAPEAPEEQQSGESECEGVAGSIGQSSDQGRQAVDEMDVIIKIAQSMPSNCPAGAPKEGENPGQSPVDKPQGSRDKSQSPEKPRDEPGDKPGQKPQEPKDNKSSEEDGKNEPGDRTPGSETEAPPNVTDQREHWGDLPVHVRDVFRAEGGPGMPAEYRDWIDAYYRRLNARSSD